MLDNTKKKKKRIYKCHNLSGNPEKDSRESAFAVEALNNSTFKSHELYIFCIFFLKKTGANWLPENGMTFKKKIFLLNISSLPHTLEVKRLRTRAFSLEKHPCMEGINDRRCHCIAIWGLLSSYCISTRH